MNNLIDLYTDYLLSSFGQTTATGLSRLIDNHISHDKITRLLSTQDFDSKDLWKMIKRDIRKIESENGLLIFDDTIEEKPHTQENDVICWHYDHSKGKSIKGVNIVTCLYNSSGLSLPISFEVITKPISYDIETQESIRNKSDVTKNEILCNMLDVAVKNQVKFSCILADIWYSSSKNMKYIVKTIKKDFVMPVKNNRLVALSKKDKNSNNFVNIKSLKWQDKPVKVWMKGVPFELLIHKQVFRNKDNSIGFIYLATNNLDYTKEDMETLYKKRWSIEVFHKTLKQNTSLAKSPTKVARTQKNHIFMSILASVKLELLSFRDKRNHFSLKMKLYTKAIKSAFKELKRIKKKYGVEELPA